MNATDVISIVNIIRANEVPLRKIKGLVDIGICQDQDGLYIVAYISDVSIVDRIPSYLRDIRVCREKVN